jgi:hypothetical protein
VANMPENVAWQRLLEQQKVHDRKKKWLSPEKSVITI